MRSPSLHERMTMAMLALGIAVHAAGARAFLEALERVGAALRRRAR
jgi:hypothetical protein